MENNEFIAVAGIVQFDPRDRTTTSGMEVRDVQIRTVGSSKRVSITVWPSHANVPINKGDFIVADGTYTQNQRQNQQGEMVTYHNLSATAIVRIPGDAAEEAPAPKKAKAAAKPKDADVEASDDGDDFPF